MAQTIEELREELAKLQKLRAGGVSKVEFRDRSTTFKSDAEMANAIRDLEERIAKLDGQQRAGILYVRPVRRW